MTVYTALGLGTAAITAAAVYLSRDFPATLHAHLLLLLLAGALWLLALWRIRSPDRNPRASLRALWIVALLLRLPAWASPPRHSDDVYRYLWDGAVQHAGHNPYAGPPDAPVYADVQRDVGPLFQHINHRELPTIYPPAAQLSFRLGSFIGHLVPGGTPLLGWKLCVGVADLLVLFLLIRLCRGAGIDPRWAAAWGWAPLCAVEVAQNAHMDVLGILPLCAALLLWQGRRHPIAAGFLAGAAVLVKPLAAAILPPLLVRRAGSGRFRLALTPRATSCLLGLLLSLSLVLPFAAAGRAMAGSLGEYGRRWRGNDGAFALLLYGAKVVVERTYRPPYHEPWHRPALARIITGRDRDSVWPDELSSFLARIFVLFCLFLSLLGALYLRLPPERVGLVVLSAYLLLSPVLHPWYLMWVLALCPLWPRAAPPWLVLGVLVPLGYLPLSGYLRGGEWIDPVWSRLLEHGACWALLLHALRAKQGRSLTQSCEQIC